MIRSWWDGLMQRERRLIASAVIVVVVLLTYVFVWSPVMSLARGSYATLRQEKSNLIWMQHAVRRVDVYRKGGLPLPHLQKTSLVVAVNNMLKKRHLSVFLTGKDVQGGSHPSGIKLNFNSVPFDQLIRAINVLWQQQGIYVADLQLNRLPVHGLVRVAVTLKSVR